MFEIKTIPSRRKSSAYLQVNLNGCNYADVERNTIHPLLSRMHRVAYGWKMYMPAGVIKTQTDLVSRDIQRYLEAGGNYGLHNA